jgi:L-histidine Nalpha-methyltransferase / hercynylcysteine S-oxide synthase
VLFTEAELRPIQRWVDSVSQYSLWLLERPPFMFPLLSSPSASALSGSFISKVPYSSSPFGVPSIQDWQNVWTLWDFVTRRMIPDSMLFQKPIDLRHICLFYLGHIPTFLDIHLSRLLGEPHADPQEFKDIFEVRYALLTSSPFQIQWISAGH